VSVTAGEISHADFVVTCPATQPVQTGVLRISATTAGEEQDNDGYDVRVDDRASQHIASNGDAITVNDLASGDHQVELSGISDNCTVQGENPRPVTVNADATENVEFAVSCSAPNGSIEVSTSTSGDALDEDGYLLRVDGSDLGKSVGANDMMSLKAYLSDPIQSISQVFLATAM